jgi:hypothetical protein
MNPTIVTVTTMRGTTTSGAAQSYSQGGLHG